MPDYDVGIIAIPTPSDPTPLGTLRPSVVIANNGLHDAIVSGYVHAYDPDGELCYDSALLTVAVPAGETRVAMAAATWRPADTGAYSLLAVISTGRDENPLNNQLNKPVTITGAAAPPTAEHGNEAHDPDMLTEPALADHAALQANVHGYDDHGDLGIGGPPDDRAALDVHATTKAFIPPRVTTLQKNQILPPSAGMVVYDTDLNKLCLYTGAAWETIQSA